ncbi:tRNA (adenine(22)-N(1))-methyltransferase [Sporotomaculum syntrophicum]|uniref:tRNA (Adenine(22)-N(1))-methyltransferase n=1 Tax=Sporotomaculum syntrophicum TaxID=182264 RepID=A0A9D2WP49_9FIRM|nr:class I SAM-dependent methyltransferase [Sporotomaculum syntrophicum]KAF1084052.1 tRNA (adenine(22)-N(1))-methyltransferase [Sporotomaculum syntrophicum]
MELSRRLAALARHVPAGETVADIGTDHAYLPIYLIQQGISPWIVAGDINRKPYEAARLNVQSSGLNKSIDLRLGDGLNILKPGEVSVLVVAGMGGKTVCTILEQGRAVLQQMRRLVIQPMNDIYMVRRWLLDNGWRLADEEMVVEDRHYYVIIVAERGRETNKDRFALEVGPRLLEKKDVVLKEFLTRRIMKIKAIITEITRAESAAARNRVLLLRQEAMEIEEVLNRW